MVATRSNINDHWLDNYSITMIYMPKNIGSLELIK